MIDERVTDHDGKWRLDECFETIDVDVLLALANNHRPGANHTTGMTALCKATGLSADLIRARIRPWTFAKYKRIV